MGVKQVGVRQGGHVASGTGLLVACAAAMAWLLGVYGQTGEVALQPLGLYVVATVSACVVMALCALWHRRGVSQALGLVLSACLLAWATTGWRATLRMQEALPAAWVGQDVTVVVQVEGLPQAVPGGVIFDARVLRWVSPSTPSEARDTLPTRLSLRMNLQDDAMPWAGQQWQLTVQLHPPDGLSNPAGFDSTLGYFERGVRAVGRVANREDAAIKLSDQAERPWQGLIDRWRQRIRTVIFDHVADKRAAGIFAGLSIGDQSAIERDDWNLFRQTGVAHLVSISGAHIAMFGWMAAGLIRRLWSRWPRGVHWWPAPDVAMWASVLASALYALLAGWGVPAQRTVWMMLMMAGLRSSGRRWPWPLIWLTSAVCLTAMDPWAIRQVGFWLSYVAVGVLLSADSANASSREQRDRVKEKGEEPPKAWWLRGLHQAWQSLHDIIRIQFLITAALLPLSLVCFQQASISSLVANLVAIPVFTLGITPLSLLGTIWPPCWDLGTWLVNEVTGFLALLLKWWPTMAESPVMPAWVAVVGVIAGFALARPMHWRWRLAMLPCVLPLLYLPQPMHLLPAPRPGAFQLMAVDVGQGTAVLVRTAHHQLLFDTGPRIGEQLNAGDRTLLPLFRAMGVSRLDMLMISHQDMDHVGGAQAIIQQMPVAQLVSSLDEGHALRHQVGADGKPLPHTACEAGMQWDWDGVHFEVLHPWPQDYAERAQREPNAMSCVLKVSEPGASALLTGDIEAEQEAALVEQDAERLQSTVLIAAHHGSKTSSTEAFLRAVQPRQIVVQAGRRNRYGHPAPAVLARYQAMDLAWVASPDCGAYLWDSREATHNSTSNSTRNSTTDSTGSAQAASPQVGQCWRPAHHHYWDQPAPMNMEAQPRSGKRQRRRSA
ncbi:MAG: DNA internalization-related competence protein ComEC/Rec2 [Burkholderiales bacterium]|nr:MAG: DNA internalization-related competence protein ComEC/Rec2 [Burkholderiales bacterium]